MDSNVQIIEGLLQKSENEVLELKEAKVAKMSPKIATQKELTAENQAVSSF